MVKINSADSSKGGVILNPPLAKKKQVNPAVKWCFTWNNYPEDWKEIIVPKFQSLCHGWVAGLEVGELGTPHVQGFITMQKGEKVRPITAFGLPKQIKWIAAKGTLLENVKYCTKDGQFEIGGTCKGALPYTIELELKPWQKKIVSIIEQPPDGRTIWWFWEPKGGLGKTTFQKWLCLNFEGVTPLGGKHSDMKNGICQYKEQFDTVPTIILVNLPMTFDQTYFSYTGTEECKDMFFYSPKYKGGPICERNPHLLIFANEPPKVEDMAPDRWRIVRLPDGRGKNVEPQMENWEMLI